MGEKLPSIINNFELSHAGFKITASISVAKGKRNRNSNHNYIAQFCLFHNDLKSRHEYYKLSYFCYIFQHIHIIVTFI